MENRKVTEILYGFSDATPVIEPLSEPLRDGFKFTAFPGPVTTAELNVQPWRTSQDFTRDYTCISEVVVPDV